MLEESRRRLLIGVLIILAGTIFGLGINWGLPSHAIDPILFGNGADSATHSLHSYTLTGVGISRLAGAWEDNSSLPADAAAHAPIDRSKPITLLENRHGLTEEQLLAQGDPTLATLSAAADAADKKYAALRMGNNAKAADAAQDESLAAQQKIHQYVQQYNRKNFGDLATSANADDVARAKILRRYRLYSDQPDEMISLRALAVMHPGQFQFDPKLYQYGGLWIYPLGAIIKSASLVGYVTVSNDPTVYLDSPQTFGKFYILARAYSAVWGIVAVLAVFAIIRRAGAGLAMAFIGAICFACMPAVVDLAHEAKPHLAGVAIFLLAALAASKYVGTGKWKWAVWTAIACGACAGMVLSGVVALAILPVMSLLRRDLAGKFLAICGAGIVIAAAIYFATNPYVAIHLVGDRTVLRANLANSNAMYAFAPNVGHAFVLLLVGMGPAVALVGVIGIILRLVSKRSETMDGLGWIIGVPAILVLIAFSLHAGNKPGEYARFALPVDAAFLLAAFIGIGLALRSTVARAIIGIIVLAFTVMHSAAYERGFMDDGSRTQAAQEIDAKLATAGDSPVLYLTSEPAPYCLPPVNLFRWKMILLPSDGQVPHGFPAGILVKPFSSVRVMDPEQSPLSWANPGFEVAEVGGK